MTDFELHNGDIVLIATRGPLGWLLRFLSGETYNHVALAWKWPMPLQPMLVDAGALGVAVHPWQSLWRHPLWGATRIKVLRPKKAPDDRGANQRVVAWALSQVDRPYGYLKLLRLAWAVLRARLLKWLGGIGPLAVPHGSFICTEFVAEAWRHGAGINIVPGLEPGAILPSALEKSPALIVVGEAEKGAA